MADILIVDDEDDIRDLVAGILDDEGHGARLARNSDEAIASIEARRPQLILLDIWLQGSKLDGLQLLEMIKRQHPSVPVVMISGHGNIETAVTAIKLGAYDFIEKPFKADRLILIAERALETSRLKREVSELRTRGGAANQHGWVVGSDRQSETRHRQARARKLARADFRRRPGRARNWRQGSFTNIQPAPTVRSSCSTRRRCRPRGWRRSCSASKPSPNAPGGSARSKRRTAARSISTKSPTCRGRRRPRSCASSSTRTSSASEARRGCMSTCGSSRRRVVILPRPSPRGGSAKISFIAFRWCRFAFLRLAERRDDIPELVQYFLEMAAASMGVAPRRIAADAMAVLQSHDWPGNIRQLRNNVERLMILALGDPNAEISAAMLPAEVGALVPTIASGDRRREAVEPSVARRARSVRARLPRRADQPVRRQYFAHRGIHRHGALGAAPQAEVARGRVNGGRLRQTCHRSQGRRPGRPEAVGPASSALSKSAGQPRSRAMIRVRAKCAVDVGVKSRFAADSRGLAHGQC